jgi:hypothetical protein
VIPHIDSVRHQHVSVRMLELGSRPSSDVAQQTCSQIAPALISLVDELRLLRQSRIDGSPIEGLTSDNLDVLEV